MGAFKQFYLLNEKINTTKSVYTTSSLIFIQRAGKTLPIDRNEK